MNAIAIRATMPSDRPAWTRSLALGGVHRPLGEQAERVDRDQHHVRGDLGDLELLGEPLAGVDRPFADQDPDRELPPISIVPATPASAVPTKIWRRGGRSRARRAGRASWRRLRCCLAVERRLGRRDHGHLGEVVERCRRGGGPLERLRVPRIVARRIVRIVALRSALATSPAKASTVSSIRPWPTSTSDVPQLGRTAVVVGRRRRPVDRRSRRRSTATTASTVATQPESGEPHRRLVGNRAAPELRRPVDDAAHDRRAPPRRRRRRARLPRTPCPGVRGRRSGTARRRASRRGSSRRRRSRTGTAT